MLHLPLGKPLMLIVLLCIAAVVSASEPCATHSGADITNPHVVFRTHYAVTGGLEKWKGLRAVFSRGRVEYDGLKGRFRSWDQFPLSHRTEEDFGVISHVRGDSGAQSWYQDTNAQVDLNRDIHSLKRRNIARALNEYEHLNENSGLFSLELKADEHLNGQLCYVVQMRNTLNSDTTEYFFGKDDFLLHATRHHQPDIEVYTLYSDFRRSGELSFPFHVRSDISPRQKRHEIWIDEIQLNPEIDTRLFQVPVAADAAVRFYPDTHAVRVPFELVDGGIYVSVRIGSAKAIWQIDSGASASMIDLDYAHSLGLAGAGQIKGFGFGGNFDVAFVDLPGLQLGTERDSVGIGAITVMGYAHLADTSYEPVRYGVLGHDFLRHFIVYIDYAARIVTFYSASKPESLPHQPCWQDAPLQYRMPVLSVCVADQYQGNFSVDTGAQHSTFYRKYAQKYALDRRDGIEHVSRGIGGVSVDTLVRFPSMRLAGLTLPDPLISIPSPDPAGTETIGQLAGNIGASVLQHFDLWLDLSRQRIALEPGSNFAAPDELDKSGITVGMSYAGEPMVSYVAADTPAHRAGVRAGDMIISLDGIAVNKLGGVRSIRRLLTGSEHECRNIGLLRDGKKLHIRICLEQLL